MRLLQLLRLGDRDELVFTQDFVREIPPYAILSHTWSSDPADEVSYQDVQNVMSRSWQNKLGFQKILFCGRQAERDGYSHFWVDTCCIDKTNSNELTEAINSMFRWYQGAQRCYVYLADVVYRRPLADELPQSTWERDFRNSRWFTRGWTLQELVAPHSVEFFSKDNERLGDKNSLEQQIFEITGIAVEALRGHPLDSFSVEQRMAWADSRITTKEEDIVYSLLGIFNVHVPLIYGEGSENALRRLTREITHRVQGSLGRNGRPILRNDSIFQQERLMDFHNTQSFLEDALSSSGQIRVVLYGLPGIGKSTMARSFAYNAQRNMAVLWIPGDSEAVIKQAFEQYARQLCGTNLQYPDPMPIVTRQLTQHYSGQWLVVFDGLDIPVINIQQYLFADVADSKIIITTRIRDVAPVINATHVRPMRPLDENLGQDLLSLYMNVESPTLAAGQSVRREQVDQETGTRMRIARELGGLPLAIAIVGAALRRDTDIPSINGQQYLQWAEEVRDTLLEQDPIFSDYPSSVWKSFGFAFQGLLQGTGVNENAASMAHFVASCDNVLNLAEYIGLYRKFRTGDTENTWSSTIPRHSAIGHLRFLEAGYFDLAIRALASVSMITVNSTGNNSDDIPHIEMHALVRKWLVSTARDKVHSYAGSKLWLLGFGMYDQLNRGQIRASKFDVLLKEASQTLIEHPRSLDDSQVPASEVILPLLLDAQRGLSKAGEFLPAGATQRNNLHQFRRGLECEMIQLYEECMADTDWKSVFQDWARELGEQVEYAVRSDAENDDYMLKHFFLDTLDSHGCIPNSFHGVHLYEFHSVDATATIQGITADITAQMESLLLEQLAQEAFSPLPAVQNNERYSFICDWSSRWGPDVKEIVRDCLTKVFMRLQSGVETQLHPAESSSPLNIAAAADLQVQFTLNDPRNAFFAVLRRTVKAATVAFLDSCPAATILNEEKDMFRDVCEHAIRQGFGDRASAVFFYQPLSADVDTYTAFGMLWSLAWPTRFPGDLHNLISAETFDTISADLKNASKQGFIRACWHHLSESASEFVEELADEVFNESAISNTFPNWILSGWIDSPSDDDDGDSDQEEPTYKTLMRESEQQTMSALRSIYNRTNAVDHSTLGEPLKLTLYSRRAMHEVVMDRLNRPGITDRTGLGPFFAKMHFADCDKSLRLACSILQTAGSEDFAENLDQLIRIENAWNISRSQ